MECRDDLLAVNDALDSLARIHARKARIVELLYFGGLTQSEAADVLGISLATLKRDWAIAKGWLRRELAGN